MSKITYADKITLNENTSIADINKVKASDLNEIKTVVNQNDDNTTTNTTEISTINTNIGDLNNLETADKSNVVNAINEINNKKITLTTGGPAVPSGRIIDGKIEYVKRIDLGQLPNTNEGKSVIDGLEHTAIVCTKIDGFATDSTGAYQNTLNGFDTRLSLNPEGLSITIKNESYVAFYGVADVYYFYK